MNFIAPIILIIISGVIFFGYVDPNYKGSSDAFNEDYSEMGIKQLREEYYKYRDTVENSNDVVSSRDKLVEKKNRISEEDTARLQKMIPDNIDNVKLVLEISDIASRRNLLIKNISIGGSVKKAEVIGPDDTSYGTVSLKFSVNASYDNFISFLKDLEDNLRLIDIENVSFVSNDTGFYDFSVSVKTYWLK